MEQIANRRGWALGLVLVCALLSYHNVLWHSFHYDDEHSILENPHVRSLANVPRFFVDPGAFSGMPEARMYRPLLLVTYAANYALGGYAPMGWHAVNLLLHLVNAGLLWSLAPVLGASRRAALIAGMLFAVHPVLSESVNYVSSRSSLLATCCLLLAFKGVGAVIQGRHRAWLLVAGTYLGALMAKSIAIVFPPILALFMGLSRRWHKKGLLGLTLLSGFYVVGTKAIIGKALFEPVRGPVEQWATQIKAGVYYVSKAAFPVGLSVEPQFAVADSFFSPPVLFSGLLLLSIALLCAMGRHRILLVLGVCWFAIGLLPSALVPLHVLVNEHRLYLPMAGWALAVAALLDRVQLGRIWLVVLLLLMALTVQRNEVWRDEVTLWRDAVAKGGHMARPHVNLGKALLQQGELEEAIAVSHKALAIEPQLERAHYNIGTAYLRQERYELAKAHLRRALEIRPDMLPALNNLGNIYQQQGVWQQALGVYRKALAIQEHASIYHNIGNCFLNAGFADSARVYFRQALGADPQMREAYKGLAKACRADDRLQSAVEALNEALLRWPRDTLFLLMRGDALAALGHEGEAVTSYRRAGWGEAESWQQLGAEALKRGNGQDAHTYFTRSLALADDAAVRNGLGMAQLELGQVKEALQTFREAARQDPQNATAFGNIGRVNLRYGRHLEAIASLERAVELEPEEGHLHGLLAQALEQAGKGPAAVAAYNRAIDLDPGKGEYYHNLGYLYAQEGRVSEAEDLYKKALARNPHQAEAHFNLGGLYLDRGSIDEALAAYTAALALRPAYADALINQASAYLQLHQDEQAIVAYRQALRLQLQPAIRQRIEQQLAALEAARKR
ncbi:MAG: tetratricopeptide repeat protein [Gemmatimonadetes bacterium]|nr:tetratricopeptide repeat protein [Gemmatimonadota bacterium]